MEIDVPQPTDSTETEGQTVPMKVIEVFYDVQSGYGENAMPIVRVVGETKEGRTVLRVVSFFPFLFISESEFIERRADIEREMEKRQSTIIDYEQNYTGMGVDALEGDRSLVKLYCDDPSNVGGESGIKHEFDRTWESDVLFADRFLISLGINQYAAIPSELAGTHELRDITPDKIAPCEPPEPQLETGIVTVDIEVFTDNKGFPDYENPTQPVTALTAHDAITDEYWVGVLKSNEWTTEATEAVSSSMSSSTSKEMDHLPSEPSVNLTVYSDEQQLLHDAWTQINEWEPTCMSGWNSDGFDYPYLINRTLRHNIDAIHRVNIADEQVGWIRDAPRGTEWAMDGIVFWDGMSALQSMEIGQRKSNKLDDVAEDILGWGKADVDDTDDAWLNEPVLFTLYNILDVTATVSIREQKELVKDYDALQQLSGCRMSNSMFNKNLIDSSLMRQQHTPMGEAE